MITAREFDDRLSPCVSASQSDGAHNRFSPRVDQPYHFQGRHYAHDGPSHFQFPPGWRSEGRSIVHNSGNRFEHLAMRVAKYERPPRADIVNELVAVFIYYLGSLARTNEARG
jgi:hypothetical protein